MPAHRCVADRADSDEALLPFVVESAVAFDLRGVHFEELGYRQRDAVASTVGLVFDRIDFDLHVIIVCTKNGCCRIFLYIQKPG